MCVFLKKKKKESALFKKNNKEVIAKCIFIIK